MVPDRGIFIVADGMGGHAAGEVASEMAVRFVARELDSLRGLSDEQVAERMRTAIRTANGAIFQRTLTEHDKRGMGTTVTSLALYETRFLIGQVGDSPRLPVARRAPQPGHQGSLVRPGAGGRRVS